jgi:cytochrome c peroxidase
MGIMEIGKIFFRFNIIPRRSMMKKYLAGTAILATVFIAGAVDAAPLSNLEKVGRHLYMDKNLSFNSTQSCATCHHRSAGFADPTNRADPYHVMVSLGDDGISKGGRNAPTAAYCNFSPVLYRNDDGEWIGGMFWDGRAAGWSENLADPLAEQAQGPPLNPVEMNMPDVETIVSRVENATYAPQFLKLFGADAFADPDAAYDNIARAIAVYESSAELNRFSSPFDRGELTDQQTSGFALFTANCTGCHSIDPVDGAPGPLFTNYGYANIGVPVNTVLEADPGSVYEVPDLGLGGFLQDSGENGKFKVPTLRNVARTAPYSHNGYFPTLADMVSFHNSRDTGDWPAAEVAENLSNQVGSMGLTDQEVADIVAFLQSLTDEIGQNGR